MSATPAHNAQAKGANAPTGLDLQPAGAFLSQHNGLRRTLSPPMTIPPPSQAPVLQAAVSELDNAADSLFLAAIRNGLQDNSPSWDNNGWFIGDDSDDEDDDEDFYTSMLNPYNQAVESTPVYVNGCAPAGSFAGFKRETSARDFAAAFGIPSAGNETIRREGSLIFAMEV